MYRGDGFTTKMSNSVIAIRPSIDDTQYHTIDNHQ